MYLALENWAKKNNTFKMEAKFISNVDPDDAASVLASVDVAHSIFILDVYKRQSFWCLEWIDTKERRWHNVRAQPYSQII